MSRAERPGITGQKIALAGSNRVEPEGAVYVGDVDPEQPILITVYLKRRSPDKFQPGSAGDLARLAQPITRRALAAQRRRTHAHAAARIEQLAKKFGVTIRDIDLVGRTVMLQASARLMSEIFGATLRIYDDGKHRFRARVGQLTVPKEIAPWTRAILGFDQRPMEARPVGRLRALVGDAASGGVLPTDVAAPYRVSLHHDVSSVCVGIIALGGGYLDTDLKEALGQMGREAPVIVEKSVVTADPSLPQDPPASVNDFGGGTPADQETPA